MAFIDARLNDRYRYGFTGGPAWNTLKVGMQSGRNRKKKLWSMPHHRFRADYVTLNDAEKLELLNAFMAAGGSYAAFRFKDWNDWIAVDEVIGVGDGTSDPMQLIKTYTFGATNLSRTITLPLVPVIKSNGVVKAVTVDQLTGLVTPTTAWAVGEVITWSGQFDVRVCFAADFNPFTSAASNIRECTVELEEDFG